ncbi:MAG: acyl transferase [Bacteroidetes bacterium]|nr:acyl transferase [Bacteroidota bacterium]
MINKLKIFEINSDATFEETAIEVFKHQYQHNQIYQNWSNYLSRTPNNVHTINNIPFIPIEFFKTQQIISSPINANTVVFESSTTTSSTPSKHFINDISIYEKSFTSAFNFFFGNIKDYCILALLPNYLERKNSSLVYMVKKLMENSNNINNAFYLNDFQKLKTVIESLKQQNQKTILIGVSYALIDFSNYGIKLNDNFIVIETGGMKGTRKELLKNELHALLKQNFEITKIYSEYGMTELLSQAYSLGNAFFESPPWLKFKLRDVNDPLQIINTPYKTGGINIIDLANINSCSFIASSDLGRLNSLGKIELMGRFDNSDIRGCNLMLNQNFNF